MQMPSWRMIGCAVSLASFAGCGVCDAGLGDAAVGDAATAVPRSLRYVVATVDLEPDATDEAYGFDLDGMNGGPAGTCQGAADFTSAITGATGVDDAFAAIVPLLDGWYGGDGMDGTVRYEIESGLFLLVFDVDGIDDLATDDAITVHAMLTRVPVRGIACEAHAARDACAADVANACGWSEPRPLNEGRCTAAAVPSPQCPSHADRASCASDACSWSDVDGACSGIAADQPLELARDLGIASGRITDGRIEATFPMLLLPLLHQGIDTLYRDVRLSGRITPSTIVGEAGGTMATADVLNQCNRWGFGIDCASFVMGDLMPSADGTTCSELSVGFAFAAINAR